MLKEIAIVIGLLVLKLAVVSQNLIPNPSFEELTDCPDNNSGLYLTNSWFSPTEGTPDVFNRCHVNGFEGEYICPTDTGNNYLNSWEWAVPINIMGCQEPNTGEGYAGIILFRSVEWREYLQVELIEELIPETTYYLQLYVSIGDRSNMTTDALHFAFVNDSVFFDTEYIIDYDFNIANETGNLLEHGENWQELNFEFVAEGGEKYFVMGNFEEDGQFQTDLINTSDNYVSGSYLYVDDVYLGVDPISNLNQNYKIFDEVGVYPNPSTSTLNLENLPVGEYKYQIFDSLLKLLESGLISDKTIDVSKLPSGVYFLRINFMDRIKIIRFVVL